MPELERSCGAVQLMSAVMLPLLLLLLSISGKKPKTAGVIDSLLHRHNTINSSMN